MRGHFECLDRTVFPASEYLEIQNIWKLEVSISQNQAINNHYKSIKNSFLHYWSMTQRTWDFVAKCWLEWAFQTLKAEELHFTALHTIGALFQKPCLQLYMEISDSWWNYAILFILWWTVKHVSLWVSNTDVDNLVLKGWTESKKKESQRWRHILSGMLL